LVKVNIENPQHLHPYTKQNTNATTRIKTNTMQTLNTNSTRPLRLIQPKTTKTSRAIVPGLIGTLQANAPKNPLHRGVVQLQNTKYKTELPASLPNQIITTTTKRSTAGITTTIHPRSLLANSTCTLVPHTTTNNVKTYSSLGNANTTLQTTQASGSSNTSTGGQNTQSWPVIKVPVRKSRLCLQKKKATTAEGLIGHLPKQEVTPNNTITQAVASNVKTHTYEQTQEQPKTTPAICTQTQPLSMGNNAYNALLQENTSTILNPTYTQSQKSNPSGFTNISCTQSNSSTSFVPEVAASGIKTQTLQNSQSNTQDTSGLATAQGLLDHFTTDQQLIILNALTQHLATQNTLNHPNTDQNVQGNNHTTDALLQIPPPVQLHWPEDEQPDCLELTEEELSLCTIPEYQQAQEMPSLYDDISEDEVLPTVHDETSTESFMNNAKHFPRVSTIIIFYIYYK
jgi:hypothetical protein